MVQMRGSSNFHQGGEGPGQSDKKALTTIFLVLSLFYRSQMVNFKKIYRFSRLQMGSNFFQGVQLFPGGVQLLIPYINPFNLGFSRGGPDPLPPPPLWIRTWCSPHSFMVKATIYNWCILLRLTSGFVNPRTVMFTEVKRKWTSLSRVD